MRIGLLIAMLLLPSSVLVGQEELSEADKQLQAAKTESKVHLHEYVGLPTDATGTRAMLTGDATQHLRAQIKREMELDLKVQMQRVDAAQRRLADAKRRIERSAAAIETLVDQEMKARVAAAEREKLELKKAEENMMTPRSPRFETPDDLLAYFKEAAARGEADFSKLTELMTDDCVNEMAGLMLQQVSFVSVLNQIGSQTGGIIGDSEDGPVMAPMGAGLLASELLEKHILEDRSDASEQAFTMLVQSTIDLAFSDNGISQIGDPKDSRIAYRLAAGVLKSPREFLQNASAVTDAMSDDSSKSQETVSPQYVWEVTIDGDKASVTGIADSESSNAHLQLRRIDDRWMIDSVLSDEMVQQIALGYKGVHVSDD